MSSATYLLSALNVKIMSLSIKKWSTAKTHIFLKFFMSSSWFIASGPVTDENQCSELFIFSPIELAF